MRKTLWVCSWLRHCPAVSWLANILRILALFLAFLTQLFTLALSWLSWTSYPYQHLHGFRGPVICTFTFLASVAYLFALAPSWPSYPCLHLPVSRCPVIRTCTFLVSVGQLSKLYSGLLAQLLLYTSLASLSASPPLLTSLLHLVQGCRVRLNNFETCAQVYFIYKKSQGERDLTNMQETKGKKKTTKTKRFRVIAHNLREQSQSKLKVTNNPTPTLTHTSCGVRGESQIKVIRVRIHK